MEEERKTYKMEGGYGRFLFGVYCSTTKGSIPKGKTPVDPFVCSEARGASIYVRIPSRDLLYYFCNNIGFLTSKAGFVSTGKL